MSTAPPDAGGDRAVRYQRERRHDREITISGIDLDCCHDGGQQHGIGLGNAALDAEQQTRTAVATQFLQASQP